MEQVLENVTDINVTFFFTHNLPLPDCFNNLVERVLRTDCTHLLFIEEDMALPRGIIDDLIATGDKVVTADYPVNLDHPTSVIQMIGHYLVAGTGLLLVDRAVFENLSYPYFRAQPRDNITLEPIDIPSRYGNHDIDFYVRVQDLGYDITVLTKAAGQYRVRKYGESETNNGQHEIVTMNLPPYTNS